MDTTETPQHAPPKVRHVTDGWYDLTGGTDVARVCEHWACLDAPGPTPVMQRDGTQAMAGPGPVRSYIGLVIEVGDAQLQVRGRLRHGGERLVIEVG